MVGIGLPQPTSRQEAVFVTLNEDEFAQILRDTGWGDSAIETELEVLRDYKKRFHLEEKKPQALIEDDSSVLVQAVRRKNKRLEEKDA